MAHAHDRYFRAAVTRRQAEQAALVATMFPRLAARLEPDSFEVEPGSYIDPHLRERQSDILLRARLAGRDILIYLLIEHQRSVDQLMAWRILGYQMRIWDRYVSRHPGTTRIPAILPTVIYQGDRPWTAATDIADLIDLTDTDNPDTDTDNLDPGNLDPGDLDPDTASDVKAYLPRARYRLDDLTRIDIDTLRARPLTPRLRLTLTLLKTAPGNDQIADLLDGDLFADLAAVHDEPEGLDHLIATVTYIMNVADVAPDQLTPVFTRLGHDAQEALMTTAERLRTEGRIEGEARGQVKGQATTLLRQLAIKFGPLPEGIEARVRAATPTELDTWTERILTATTLTDTLD